MSLVSVSLCKMKIMNQISMNFSIPQRHDYTTATMVPRAPTQLTRTRRSQTPQRDTTHEATCYVVALLCCEAELGRNVIWWLAPERFTHSVSPRDDGGNGFGLLCQDREVGERVFSKPWGTLQQGKNPFTRYSRRGKGFLSVHLSFLGLMIHIIHMYVSMCFCS